MIKVAVGQICSLASLPRNANIIKKLIKAARKSEVEILFLPEASDYLSKNAQHSLELSSTVYTDFLNEIQAEVRRGKGPHIFIGIHEPSGERVRNNHIWISPLGEIEARYQKIHLFDVDIPNGPILKESNSVEPGNTVVPPVSIGPLNIGLGICYDIRFPELALRLRTLGANMLTYPLAFTTTTGKAHWKVLAQARALDTQCFVILAAQCGEHDVDASTKRESYGQSLIIDPWGAVVVECSTYTDRGPVDEDGDYYELGVAELDMDKLEKVRENMPLWKHKRDDVFGKP